MKASTGKWLVTISLSVILLSLLVLRWQIATLKIFDADELVHLHTSWLMTHGSLPYKDFFTGYPPTFYLLLAPLMLWLPPSDFLPILVRQIFFGIFLSSMFILYKLSRMVMSREFSLLGLVLVASSVFFIERGVEVRPDHLVVFLWLLAVFLLSRGGYFWSGVSTGLMATLTQKSIYGVIAMLILVLFVARSPAGGSSLKGMVKRLLKFGVGLALFPLLVLFYLWQNNLLSYLPDFLVRYPLLLGSEHQWEYPWYHLGFIVDFTNYAYFSYFYKNSVYWLRSSQFIWVSAIALTIFWVGKNLIRGGKLTCDDMTSRKFFLWFLGPSLLLSLIYLLTISMKIPQYWLIPTPLVMLSCVFGLSELSTANKYLKKTILLLSCLGLTVLSVDLWGAWARDFKRNNNFRQREDIRATLVYTKPTDAGYDGNGSYIFRHDCFYFSLMVPQEIPPSIFRSLMTDLSQEKCDFILRGTFSRMVDWTSEVNTYVDTHFTPIAGSPDLFIRNK